MITIKNIIFDLGGVILKDKPISTIKNINKKDYQELKKFFNNWEKLDLGEYTLEDKFNKCNFPPNIEKKYKDILTHYYKYRKINTELINTINKLKDSNYNIYILSDNNKDSFTYYKNHKLFKNIDGWIVSCEYNTLKKDGELFNILIKKYNLNPNECYFIDDNIINIKKAKEYGIEGQVFNQEQNINNLYNDIINKIK